VVLAVTIARPAPTPGPLSRDFEAYWAAGATSNAGADPYGRAIWNSERAVAGVDARRDEILPFVGPPHTLLFWRIVAWLPYERAAHLWWAVLAISLLALVGAVVGASGVTFTARAFFGGIVLAIAFAPISSDLALGQIALPAFLGTVLVAVLAERRLTLGVVAAPIAFAQPNISLGLLTQLGRNRTTVAMLAGAALTYVLGALAAGWSWPSSYARIVAEHGLAERFVAIQFGPAAIAFDLGAPQRLAETIALVIALLAIGAAVAICLAAREPFARFAACSALVPFVAGFFHEHDFVVVFAAALWCALRTRGNVRAIALAGTLLAGFDWLGLAQRQTGLTQSALLAAAAFAAFAALGEKPELRRATPVAVGMGALIAGAALVAVHNPVPIWPDALRSFHASLTASIASIWLDEQQRSGLLAAVPAWGLLRSCSLLGSALLAYAIYRHPSCCRTA
jgi:hypothetical protein